MKKPNRSLPEFVSRHVGPRHEDLDEMLQTFGLTSLEELVDKAVPSSIRTRNELLLPSAISERAVLELSQRLASENTLFRSLIGMGYTDTVTPPVIQRNILENPGWYTQYTPYQAEISQGRLEALLNFQTMISDLTGLPLANASLLDEGTAAAEAVSLAFAARGCDGKDRLFISNSCHPQTIEVVKTRAERVGIKVETGDHRKIEFDKSYFAALVQYPCTDGCLHDYRGFAGRVHEEDAILICAADILSLCILEPPGEWGADVAVGSTQRFGVPMGFGGPHAAYLSVRSEFQRLLPGRLVGVSKDATGKPAYRLSLQTREQHIRRDRATSNICTAQVLLAIMAGMYGVYHGPEGLRAIATRVARLTLGLASALSRFGINLRHKEFFDTLRFEVLALEEVRSRAEEEGYNLRYFSDGSIGLTLDELTDEEEIERLLKIITCDEDAKVTPADFNRSGADRYHRSTSYLTHPVFNSYHSETELLRYIYQLQARDLSLTSSMIPLGSCTMKLNAAAEMLPITLPGWNALHPFAPLDQAKGYLQLFRELEEYLCDITGMAKVSLQPNSGAQGEFAGLLTISRFHESRSQGHRNVCLIPKSAHGTNPASAVMAGMKVVPVKCAENGDVDIADLEEKATRYRDELAALMVTYPSTHGVFEESIRAICDCIHENGGQVYLDGANMNALVGICRPGEFGVDVCHLNLHKTFCIPHGGGGPGVGPIAVAEHLAPCIPGHFHLPDEKLTSSPVAAAPWGSASILPVSWAYIRLMGSEGLKHATQVAILNANYIAHKLESSYPVLYRGLNGMVAHECILDCRNFKRSIGITVADIAKRLMDFGFHAPTISWPVVETVMVEPTESESKRELDRFCEAMITIRGEIEEISAGKADPTDNVLKNAPHTAERLVSDEWEHSYSREKAAYPLPWIRKQKFWTACSRIDDTYGDRHLFCACVPPQGFDEE